MAATCTARGNAQACMLLSAQQRRVALVLQLRWKALALAGKLHIPCMLCLMVSLTMKITLVVGRRQIKDAAGLHMRTRESSPPSPPSSSEEHSPCLTRFAPPPCS